jgi:SulP family sulfate permease
VVQYLPNFFFGALLTVFGIEIAGDWLFRSCSKVSRAEYVLLLATFLAIMQLGLEQGVAAGMLLCTIYFAVTYARVRRGGGGHVSPVAARARITAAAATRVRASVASVLPARSNDTRALAHTGKPHSHASTCAHLQPHPC